MGNRSEAASSSRPLHIDFRFPFVSDRRAIATLLALVTLIYIPFLVFMHWEGYSYLPGDCAYYRATIVSVLEDHDFFTANNVDQDPLNGQLALGGDGVHLVPKHSILMPMVSLPFYAALGDVGLLVFNVLDVLVLMALIFSMVRLFFDLRIAFATALLYGTLTLFPAYSYNYSPDVFSTVLVVGGLCALLIDHVAMSGALLGLSIFAKPSNVVPVAVIVCYALVTAVMRQRATARRSPGTDSLRYEIKRLTAFAGTFALALVPFLLANYVLYGSALASGYERTVHAHPGGVARIVHHSEMFTEPLFSGTLHVIFNLKHGLLATNPIVVLALGGALLRRHDRGHGLEFLLLGAICVAQIVFFGRYSQWASSSYSNRFLMTTVALSAVFTANLFASIRAPRAAGRQQA